MPETVASASMKAMGRRPASALGTVLIPAELLDEDAALPLPPAPVPDGWLVTVPVPAVPASAKSVEQVPPTEEGDTVVAAPLKLHALAVLCCWA